MALLGPKSGQLVSRSLLLILMIMTYIHLNDHQVSKRTTHPQTMSGYIIALKTTPAHPASSLSPQSMLMQTTLVSTIFLTCTGPRILWCETSHTTQLVSQNDAIPLHCTPNAGRTRRCQVRWEREGFYFKKSLNLQILRFLA